MSLKIKLFSSTHNNISSLENEVNSWISLNSELNFKDIKVTFSDNNVLITLLYEALGKSVALTELQASPKSFKSTLSSVTLEEEKPINIRPMPSMQKPPESTPENLASALNDLGVSFVKPGKLIQNNYSKYGKSNQKVSEDQAFNWD